MTQTPSAPLIDAAKRYVQTRLGLDALAMVSLKATADAAWLSFAAKLVTGQKVPGRTTTLYRSKTKVYN